MGTKIVFSAKELMSGSTIAALSSVNDVVGANGRKFVSICLGIVLRRDGDGMFDQREITLGAIDVEQLHSALGEWLEEHKEHVEAVKEFRDRC